MSYTNSSSPFQIDKFGGDNFHLWKFKMRMILEEKDLWTIVNGTENRPADTDKLAHATYEKRDNRALMIICLNLQDSEMSHIQSSTSAKEAWRTLKEIHEAKSVSNRLFLRKEFFTIKKVE